MAAIRIDISNIYLFIAGVRTVCPGPVMLLDEMSLMIVKASFMAWYIRKLWSLLSLSASDSAII